MKEMLFAAALVAALIPYAAGQDNSRSHEANFDREGDAQVPARAAVNTMQVAPLPPYFCKPCLFYAGDFDSDASDANGLSNEVDLYVSTGAAVYTPFFVPKGKTWKVTGLFSNDFLPAQVLDPATSPYEVRKGIPVAGGNGGKLVCRGTKKSNPVPTGIGAFAFPIYAVSVKGIKGCTLRSGKYWMTVIPYCTNPNDSNCQNDYRGILSNDDGVMARRFGPVEPAHNSFFNSVFYGANWDPSSKWQSSARFSVGVEGTSK